MIRSPRFRPRRSPDFEEVLLRYARASLYWHAMGFRADPESQFHNPAFQTDNTVLVYCASGGRAALAGKTLQEMGYRSVFNAGGFKELADAGLDTESA